MSSRDPRGAFEEQQNQRKEGRIHTYKHKPTHPNMHTSTSCRSCTTSPPINQRLGRRPPTPPERSFTNTNGQRRGPRNWNTACKCVRTWLVAWDTGWRTTSCT